MIQYDIFAINTSLSNFHRANRFLIRFRFTFHFIYNGSYRKNYQKYIYIYDS